MATQKPLVSIIITTKNEEKNIGNCLKSIVNSNIALEQYRYIDKKKKESIKLKSYKAKSLSKPLSYEIIVVDNNSTDRTKEIARKYTSRVYNKGPERSAQRNYGMIEKARGEYVMYLDADMILSPTVIKKAVEKFQSSSAKPQASSVSLVALYIPEIVLGNSFWSRVRRFERSFYDGTVIDSARIFKKDVFEKVGGFNEELYACEDWDLDKRIKKTGKVAVLCKYNFEEINKKLKNIEISAALPREIEKLSNLTKKPVIFHNEADFNLQKYLSKKQYYSKNFDLYIKKWGKDDPDIKKQFGLWYRYFEVFLEDGKWKKLLRHPILAGGMFTLRFLVGLDYQIAKISKVNKN